MPNPTYKLEELVGVSETSQDGGVAQFQVTLKIGFRVMSPEELQR